MIGVTVRLFAGLRETAGAGELSLALPPAATVADAWAELALRFPALPAADTVSCAVNRAYASPASPLADGDELAFIPPVSGG
ncbi:MAG TPA: MoaD/ThiS family protein [Herpetosiphonaceae bacterium]